MIGLDTNVVVRHLVQDDPIQSKVATGLFESLTPSEPGFLTTVVLVEIYWVLTRGYGISSDDVAAVLEGLADSGDIVVQDQSNARAALRDLRKGADIESLSAAVVDGKTDPYAAADAVVAELT